ncbi:MAG TPA: YbhB/YbcL family Raf kinase inhibitor-like protein [Vulgatibacter sp.]
MGFAPSDMKLQTSSFADHGAIPAKYTGEGDDVSPALSWSQAPAGTKSFVVFCHDPDAPKVAPDGSYGFVHWVLYNIPATASGIAEGSKDHTAGKNDFGKTGYGGPMPPKGHGKHHYYFWILALGDDAQLEPGLTLMELLKRIEPKVLGMNRLIGTYKRD